MEFAREVLAKLRPHEPEVFARRLTRVLGGDRFEAALVALRQLSHALEAAEEDDG